MKLNNEISDHRRYRFLILLFSILTMFGCYFCYDIPNVLSNVIFEHLTHEKKSSVLFNYLYAIISLPNIFLAFCAGFIINKFGLHLIIGILATLVFIGQLIFTVSGYMINDNEDDLEPYIISLFGRFVFGVGKELLAVCMITLLSRYFKNKELSFALCLFYSFTWIATCLCNYIVPYIYHATSFGLTLTICTGICIISLVFSFTIIYIDNYASKFDNYVEDNDEFDKQFNCKNLKSLPTPFWLIAINLICINVDFMFSNISNDFLITRYEFEQIEAARITANANLLFLIFSPLFGLITDKYGHRTTNALISTTLLLVTQILFIVLPSSTADDKSYLVYIPILIYGGASALYYAAIFSMVPLIIDHSANETAFGVCYSFMNIAGSLSPFVVGYLTNYNQGQNAYSLVHTILGLFCLCAIGLSLALIIHNKLYLGNILELPSIKKEEVNLLDNSIRDSSKL